MCASYAQSGWSGWAQVSVTDLVKYLTRYRMDRSASTLGAMIPAMSTWVPNRITTAGFAAGLSSRSSSAWSQLGKGNPVAGSR